MRIISLDQAADVVQSDYAQHRQIVENLQKIVPFSVSVPAYQPKELDPGSPVGPPNEDVRRHWTESGDEADDE